MTPDCQLDISLKTLKESGIPIYGLTTRAAPAPASFGGKLDAQEKAAVIQYGLPDDLGKLGRQTAVIAADVPHSQLISRPVHLFGHGVQGGR